MRLRRRIAGANVSADTHHVRTHVRTRGARGSTARHPFRDAALVLACYNSDNYVTNASKDKELSCDVDGPLARTLGERWSPW